MFRWRKGADLTQDEVLRMNDKTPKEDKLNNPSVNNPVCLVRASLVFIIHMIK